jgi:uncharacterized protein (DUF488 family)
MAQLNFYTVGHSNRSTEELIRLLTAAGIKTLADIRRHPGSQRFPQFDAETLRGALEAAGIIYHLAGHHLGGRRETRPESPHTALQDTAMRSYADHMDTDMFQRAVTQLENMAQRDNTAVMCAEKLPEQCHRSLLSDYLVLRGVRVIHLVDEEIHQEHVLNMLARCESARLVYDRHQQTDLFAE